VIDFQKIKCKVGLHLWFTREAEPLSMTCFRECFYCKRIEQMWLPLCKYEKVDGELVLLNDYETNRYKLVRGIK
jgi:hypothetical protein